jgi:DNA-binding winged helix-turn-helix (wHTH) protein
MHDNEPASTRLRFGVFVADAQTGELTEQGKRIRLQEQPFQLLLMLLQKPGEMVTREELRTKLWPQTIVDFDHGLNKAISKIREALGDSSENPRFVETVARRATAFLAPSLLAMKNERNPVLRISQPRAPLQSYSRRRWYRAPVILFGGFSE